jgi:hypothetical protein
MRGRVVLIGVGHGVQQRDHQGKLEGLLAERIGAASCDLIAEEATDLPTTVAQRVACRAGVPWVNMDMDRRERVLFGIHHELERRPFERILDGAGGYVESYLPYADTIREIHWVAEIAKRNVRGVIALCGVLHLPSFSARLAGGEWEVEQLDLSVLDWYVRAFGQSKVVVDDDGTRRCEMRHPT